MSDNPMPPVEIEAPRPVAVPRGLLLDVALPLEGVERAVGGVTFCSEMCSDLQVFQDSWCAEPDDDQPEEDSVDAGATFDSFAVAAREDAPWRFGPELAASRIERRRLAQLSAWVAEELATGTITGNPALADATEVLTAAYDPDEIMYPIEQLLAEGGHGTVGTIYMNPGALTLVAASYDFMAEGGIYRTSTGHYIVGDAGIPGTSPSGVDTDGKTWLYAHLGRPDVYLGPVRASVAESATFGRTRNTRSSIFVQDVLVAFEPCLVIAAEMNVPSLTVDGS